MPLHNMVVVLTVEAEIDAPNKADAIKYFLLDIEDRFDVLDYKVEELTEIENT